MTMNEIRMPPGIFDDPAFGLRDRFERELIGVAEFHDWWVEITGLPKMSHIADALARLVRRLDSLPIDRKDRQSPTPEFDHLAARSFHRLTGMDVPPERATLVAAAQAWLAERGG